MNSSRSSDSSSVPPFSLEKSIFDQTTYSGRLLRCFDVVDPRTLFTSKATLKSSVELLESFKTGTLPPGVTDEQLWQARKIKEAIIHPDTGQKILMPFRMSGYVPFGTITVIGMLLPNASLRQVFFWQWMNQSHNAGVNFANRNATKPTPTVRFIQSYFGAVTSAVTIAIGLSLGIKKAKFLTPSTKSLISRFVAYPATCAANICNISLMRQNELREGITVQDKDGNVIGTSKIAAWKAVKETGLTRIILPAPVLIIPPIAMAYLERMRFLQKRPRLYVPINAIVCTIAFAVTLPFAIAMFPQQSEISPKDLEKDISEKTTVTTLYYNKGL